MEVSRVEVVLTTAAWSRSGVDGVEGSERRAGVGATLLSPSLSLLASSPSTCGKAM